MPKVSVIIPVYNTEKYLRECLDSVVNQTLKELEIICVDDGSTDASLNILYDYAQKDNRFKVLEQKNQGPAVARNLGISVASSEYVMFLDSDDFYSLNMCEVMYDTIVTQNLDVVQASSNVIADQAGSVRDLSGIQKYLSFTKRENIDLHKSHNKLYFTHEIWNKILKKNLIQEYDIKFPLQKCGEDRCFIMQYIGVSKLGTILDEKLYNYRLCIGSLSERFENDYSLCFLSPKGLNNVLYFYKKNNIFDNNEEYFINKVCFSLKKYFKNIPSKLQVQYIKEHMCLLDDIKIRPDILDKYKLAKYLYCHDISNVSNMLNNKMVYSYTEKCFSVKNLDIHKVVTILGLKLKFKSKKLIERKRMRNLENQLQNAKKDIQELVQNNKNLQSVFNNKLQVQEKIIQTLEDSIVICQQQENLIQKLCGDFECLHNVIVTLTDKLDVTNKNVETQQCVLEKDLQKLKNEFGYKLHKYCPDNKRAEALKDWFFERTGTVLNLQNPQTFNEKIQWLKLYDATTVKTRLADKYLVRDWVKEKIGEEYLIPLLGVWDKFDDINFDELPEQFVLKCNHGSGYNIIVKDKSKFNIDDARKKINKWMNEDFAFCAGFEMHYSFIPRKIIAEKYISGDISNCEIQAWCFDGNIEFISYENCKDTLLPSRCVFTPQWREAGFKISPNHYRDFAILPEAPKYLEEFINIVNILCKGFKYVRVDFIELQGKLMFREMTFTSGSGLSVFSPDAKKYEVGKLIKL